TALLPPFADQPAPRVAGSAVGLLERLEILVPNGYRQPEGQTRGQSVVGVAEAIGSPGDQVRVLPYAEPAGLRHIRDLHRDVCGSLSHSHANDLFALEWRGPLVRGRVSDFALEGLQTRDHRQSRALSAK